jgi:hypothetical protein
VATANIAKNEVISGECADLAEVILILSSMIAEMTTQVRRI